MSIRPWTLYSWAAVSWKLPDDPTAWPKFVCAGSHVREEPCGSLPHMAHGDTVWVAELEGQPVGFAWEWVELRDGVVMFRDPNSIITNVRFLASEFRLETRLMEIVAANRIAHALPWQGKVRQELTDRCAASTRALPQRRVPRALPKKPSLKDGWRVAA